MFKFLTRKYRDKIEKLERQIEHMTWEWDKEKALYDENMRQKFYDQKVDWTIGGLDLSKHRNIHRPMCGLSEDDARIIAEKTKEKMIEQGYKGHTSFHWRESEQCYVIDVNVMP